MKWFYFIFFITFSVFATTDRLNNSQVKIYTQYTNPGYSGIAITNNSGADIMVPLKYRSPDFDSLLSNLPSGVSYCNVQDGGWSGWSGWSACSVNCGGGGTISRSRSCTSPSPSCYGSYCSGSDTETAGCSSPNPCSYDISGTETKTVDCNGAETWSTDCGGPCSCSPGYSLSYSLTGTIAWVGSTCANGYTGAGSGAAIYSGTCDMSP